MDTIKKRNRIVLCLCSILVIFASIFALIPLNKDTKVVKADTVNVSYDFVGSNFTFPIYISGTWSNGIDYEHVGTKPVMLSFSFNVSSSDAIVLSHQFVHFYDQDWVNNGSSVNEYIYVPKDNTYTFASLKFGTLFKMSGSDLISCDLYCDSYFLCSSSSFSSNIRTVSFGSYLHNPLPNFSSDWFLYYNYVKYTDIHGNYLIIALNYSNDPKNPDVVNDPSNYAMDFRTYYLSDAEMTNNEYYINGFDAGKQEGYNSGYELGSNEGYSNGYDSGKDDGYWLGYNQALENDDRYNFTNLISAVVDVPVRTFTSLFNFEILGVNLSGFFLGLLTCCIVIGVVRLIL